jgi:hypothetical protein
VSRPLRVRSQVLSTSQRLPSNFELRGLVSSHSRPGFFPLQRFPLTEIAHPSRGRLHPCSYPRTAPRAIPRSLSALVSPTPALARACLDPPTPMDSLSASKPASRSPWDRATKRPALRPLRLLRRLVPSASPFGPTQVAPRRPPILSWSFAPLKRSPSTPRILRPAQLTQERAEHAASPEGSPARPEGPCDPSRRVSPPRTRKDTRQTRRRIPIPFETGPRHLSAASLLPWPQRPRPKPFAPTFGALKYVESGFPPRPPRTSEDASATEEMPSPMRFPALSPTS